MSVIKGQHVLNFMFPGSMRLIIYCYIKHVLFMDLIAFKVFKLNECLFKCLFDKRQMINSILFIQK